MKWWFGKNSLWQKTRIDAYFANKSTDWWVGQNSWAGRLLGQSKYGLGAAGADAEKYAEVGKYAVGALLIYMVLK